MPSNRGEPHRALEHLEEFHSTLVSPEDNDLKIPVERLIKCFKTNLFAALVEIQDLTEDVLLNGRVGRSDKAGEVNRLADLWESQPPLPSSRLVKHTVSLTHSNSFPEPVGLKSQDSGLHTATASQQEVNVAWDEAGRAWEYEEITLDQGHAGLGISFVGGLECPNDDGDPCIYITKIIKGGAAEADGRLRVHDVIVRVNNTDCTQVQHEAARVALMNAGNVVRLTVKRRRRDRDDDDAAARSRPRSASVSQLRSEVAAYGAPARLNPSVSTPSLPPPPPPPHASNHAPEQPRLSTTERVQRIEFFKGMGGLGFSISGGVGNEQAPTDAGIFITKIIEGGAAAHDGRLRVGDKIVAVGDMSLENVPHHYALDVLRSTGNKVCLHVVSNPIPEVTMALTGSVPSTPVAGIRNGSFGGSQGALNQTSSPQYKPPANLPAVEHPVPLYPRTVTLVRGAHGLGFNIIGGEDGQPIYISNVHSGGVADLSRNVFKGDVLLKVNGIDLEHATHEKAALTLRNAQNPIILVLQYRPHECSLLEQKLNELTVKEWYVRTLFDFDPSREVGAPQRSMPFQYGDILHVINSADDNWWTARKVADNGDEGPEGVIPSKFRIEKRERARRRSVNFNQQPAMQHGLEGRRGSRSQLSFSRRFPFVKSTDRIHEIAEQEASTSDEPVFTYQTVEKEHVPYSRPIIVMGALSQKVNDELVNRDPDRFTSCVPHTSRPQHEGEIHGKDYYFVSKEQMEHEVANNMFVEAGTFRDNLYGTSIKAVKDVMMTGRHCLLDVGQVAIDRLKKYANIQPITVFIKPTSYHQIYQWDYGNISEDEAVTMFERCQRLEQNAGGKFNYVISNVESLDEILGNVLHIVQRESTQFAWIGHGDNN